MNLTNKGARWDIEELYYWDTILSEDDIDKEWNGGKGKRK